MAKILTKQKIYRFDEATFSALSQVRAFGKHEAKFVRKAIQEKLERDLPQIIAEQKRKQELIDCPF